MEMIERGYNQHLAKPFALLPNVINNSGRPHDRYHNRNTHL